VNDFFKRHFSTPDETRPPSHEVVADLEAAFAWPVRGLPQRFDASAWGRSANRTRLLFGRRPALLLTAATAALALYLGLSGSLLRDSAGEVNAETLVQKSEAAATAALDTRPYHLVAISQSADGQVRTQTETLYGGPGLYRSEQRDLNTGALRVAQVINGEDVWMFEDVSGAGRAAHTRSPDAMSAGALKGISAVSSPTDIVAAGSCQTASLQGTATVAGRQTYVVSLGSKAECADAGAQPPTAKAGRTATIWIDRETFLPLRTEGLTADGQVVFSYEVTLFEVGTTIAPDVFTFYPPAGVSVIEAASMQEMKEALAGGK
jgi:outer membrane lipoprotein-sorting protein